MNTSPIPAPIRGAVTAPRALDAMERLATVTRCSRGETIYCNEDPAVYWYRVVTGAARKCALMLDGRRQIVEFLLPGDLFGFGRGDEHCFSVEVVVDGTAVARYPRRSVELLAECDPEVGRRIRETAFESICRLQTRMVLLGQTSALEKVSSFLLEMADRSTADAAGTVALPMSRYDVADYLGVAVETVSRALTVLRHCGAIAFSGARLVRIIDRDALERAGDGRPVRQAAAASPVGRLRRANRVNCV